MPQHKGAELAEKSAVVAFCDGAGPAAQLSLDRLGHKLFDDAPGHIDVAAVFDKLALEYAFEVGVGDRFRQSLHPGEFEDLRSQVESSNPDRMWVGGQIAQRKDVIGQRRIHHETAGGTSASAL